MTAKTLFAKWTLLHQPPLHLSSHSLAVVGNHAFIFGGELKPRTPVSSDLTIIGLSDGSTRVLSQPSPSTIWPSPRVGSALVAVGSSLYLWGGRGGKSMSPFDSASEDLWKFDVASEKWEQVQVEQEGRPEQRSFHVLQASGDTLYLHAGCPAKGRLGTLHALSLAGSPPFKWTTLPEAPGPARGGTVLASLQSPPLLARFGGFAGYELGGPLDLFDPVSESWTSDEIQVEGGGEGPDKRSVHSFVPVSGGASYGPEKKVVAVLALGEREGAPAELGHDGAGFFHSDAWALLSTSTSPPVFSWLRLPILPSSEAPEARGWFASAPWGSKVVVQGGLNEKNERLGDTWILEVVEKA